uniref:Uncharacterized protein n=1 Tax=Rhizophora mucronata TaxID=61149 RepID=A0A2P2NH26_RHIMU
MEGVFLFVSIFWLAFLFVLSVFQVIRDLESLGHMPNSCSILYVVVWNAIELTWNFSPSGYKL